MTRLFHALVLGLVGAGIVHIAVLLLLPRFSERDAWSDLASRADFYTVTPLDPGGAGTPAFRSIGPLFDAAACRFDLGEGIVRLSAEGDVPFWSISVYDRAGQNIFSFNDRAAPDGKLDFVVATPDQMIGLRNDLPAAFERSVFVEADISEGIAVVRAFVPDDSWEPLVSRYLQGVGCTLH